MTAATDAVTVPGAPVPARWTTGTWKIDPAHTTAGFAVRHLMSRSAEPSARSAGRS
jgi:polyisoprenoid-binding protein YceI